MHIASIGIDLGKTTFHLVALGERNKAHVPLWGRIPTRSQRHGNCAPCLHGNVGRLQSANWFNPDAAGTITTAGVFTTLYSFTGGADGGQPYGDLVFDAAGNLYGTTVLGGA